MKSVEKLSTSRASGTCGIKCGAKGVACVLENSLIGENGVGSAERRIRILVDLINKYNHEYYVLDAPTVSDDEWDCLYRELQGLEAETGLVLPDSPTQKIGGGALAVKAAFKKHRHIFPLLSLDKAQSIEEVRKWFEGVKLKFPLAQFVAAYKFDGVRLVLTYEGGRLVTAATRGDGLVGEDVTEQVKTISSIPHIISTKDKIEVGGEGMMRKSLLPEGFKNTRNAAAGAIRNIDASVTAKQKLSFFAYALNYADGREVVYSQALQLLGDFGFPVMLPKHWGGIESFSELEGIIAEITAERAGLDFDIDGIVVSVDDPAVRAELGVTVKFPRWAQAYKFEAEVVTTKLLDIVWQVGRSGKVTPVAILEAAPLCGATVTRATLNNFGDIIRKGVRIGEDVVIRRSNDVIPEVLGSAGGCQSNVVDIDKCPCCSFELTVVGANKFCRNQDCSARILEKFSHFVSRDCMNIEGLSEKTLEVLISRGFVRRLGDIYRLTALQFEELEGFKDKKISNLLLSIEKSRKVDFARLVYAFGIPNIGKKASGVLASSLSSVNELFEITFEKLVGLEEFGEVMAKSVIQYFDIGSRSRVEAEDLCVLLDIQFVKAFDGVLSGLSICITGTLVQFTRAELGKVLVGLGAVVVDSVSKSTDVLIVGESAGGKLEKARKLGVKIVEENRLSDFLASGRI